MSRRAEDQGMTRINPPRTPLVGADGRLSADWWRYFHQIGDQANSNTMRLRAIETWSMPDAPNGNLISDEIYQFAEVVSASRPSDAPGELSPPAIEPDAGVESRLSALEEALERAHVDSLQMIDAYRDDLGLAVAEGNAIIRDLLSKGKRYVWRDLQGPASAVNLTGPTNPPDADEDGGLLFDDVAVEQIGQVFQIQHDWAGNVDADGDGVELRYHVHWSKTTDAVGDVEWEMRYRVFSAGVVPPAWSSWTAADSRSSTVDATQKQLIDGFPAIDISGQSVSAIISIQMRRNTAATDDTYGDDAKLWSADCHYLVDGLKMGSDLEYTKLNWTS